MRIPGTLVLLLVAVLSAQAQLTVSGQIRTRTELRNGQGTIQRRDTARALFTSQRSRVSLAYTGYRFKVLTTLQDVRVWGQDASSINRTSTDAYDGLLMHEAWAEISLVDTGRVIKNFSVRIGRQELVYDDVRLLGNLDWLQQARRHDAVVVRFDHHGWTAHLGGAYNQNAERKANTIYNGVPTGYAAGTNTMGALYKSMQYFYVNRKLTFGNTSFLFFKDDFSRFHYAPADVEMNTPIYERGVWSRYTLGANVFGSASKSLAFSLSAFYQGGHYREGTRLNEYLLSVAAQYAIGKKWSTGPGVDITSGNNGSDPAKRFQRFDPLYGTPHKFWGYMDYFYVADGFGSNGLVDYYLKTKYKGKDNLTLLFDLHEFVLPTAVAGSDAKTLRKNLGTEVDFVFNWQLTKNVTVEGGYAAMFSTRTMASTKVKNVPDAARFSDWTYVMINIKPEHVFKSQ